MYRKILNKKSQVLFLVIPFAMSLQASTVSQDTTPRSRSVPPSPSKIIRSPRDESTTLVCLAGGKLTPKERQLTELVGRPFYQLQNNNTATRSPSIGLWVVVDIVSRLRSNELGRDALVTLDYNELEQIAEPFSPSDLSPLTQKVNPDLIQRVSWENNIPILYAEIGNGPGPLDIAKRVTFAWPDERGEVVVQRAWFWDNELLEIINRCGPEFAVIFHNSHFKRTLFSLPNNYAFSPADELKSQMPLWQKAAICNISRNRIIRNVGLVTALAGGGYATYRYLLPIIIGSPIGQHISNLLQKLPSFKGSPSPSSTPPAN